MNLNVNVPLWHQEVLRAATPDDVLSAVRDYLVLWKPSELAELPERCDPSRFRDPRDVSKYASALLQHEADSIERGTAREALTAFFAVAARRLADIELNAESVKEETAQV